MAFRYSEDELWQAIQRSEEILARYEGQGSLPLEALPPEYRAILSAYGEIETDEASWWGSSISAKEARRHNFGGWVPRPTESGLPWMGAAGTTYADEYDLAAGIVDEYGEPGPAWRIFKDESGTYRSIFNNVDSKKRLEEIEQSVSRPMGPTESNRLYSRQQVGLPSHGEVVRRSDKKLQLRNALGQFSKMLKAENSDIEREIRRFIVLNYQRLGFRMVSKTVILSLIEAEVEFNTTQDEGKSWFISVTPKELERPARQNEAGGVKTSLIIPSLIYGHRAIVPVKQRFLRFKAGGNWVTTRNVRPTQGKNFMELLPDQLSVIAEKFASSMAAAIESAPQG